MRQITKDIQLFIGGSPQGFRLTKPDAFTGVEILRLLLRLQQRSAETARYLQSRQPAAPDRPRPLRAALRCGAISGF